MGKGREDGGASVMASLSWLVPSHVADNAVVVLAAAQQAGCSYRAALEVRSID